MKRQNVLTHIGKLEKEADGEFGEEARKALEHLDREITEMMSAEKTCGKLYTGNHDFSPQVKYWVKRGRAIRALIRYKANGVGNVGSIKRVVRRWDVKALLTISTGKLVEMMSKCKTRCRALLAESPWLRRQFLAARLQEAVDNSDIKRINEVKAIIRAEN